MATPEELMLRDLLDKYASVEVDRAYSRLYPEQGLASRMFAYFHGALNDLFAFMNSKARTNRHFNADESRRLIALMEEIQDARTILRRVGMGFEVTAVYTAVLDYCKTFLSESYGSGIPDDFKRIELVKYEPVFISSETEIRLPDRWKSVKLKMVGEGAYARVYEFTDPEYGSKFALKRAKRDLSEADLIRFRKEFELLKKLRFPYVLEVHRYSSDRHEYTMEHCDETLAQYIERNNARLSFETRRRVALQFLYGLYYLHSKGYLHRDVSYRNVLVKRYDGVAAVVKLSDFGLIKELDSEFTRTNSELRGTILDPTIQSFKEYDVVNEIYSIGFVLSFIFSGRRDIAACRGAVRAIIDKCVAHDRASRYQSVRPIIFEIEGLSSSALGSRSEAPA
ncbi:protein kinase family protein [Micromonospora sp. URMC 107]|uniref:protein kinase family protein n=1 Tax=Micromonospora sp. URMC 107 TaxID=3423418 RepID=UPI003F1AEE4F